MEVGTCSFFLPEGVFAFLLNKHEVVANGGAVDLLIDILWMSLDGGRAELGFPSLVSDRSMRACPTMC